VSPPKLVRAHTLNRLTEFAIRIPGCTIGSTCAEGPSRRCGRFIAFGPGRIPPGARAGDRRRLGRSTSPGGCRNSS